MIGAHSVVLYTIIYYIYIEKIDRRCLQGLVVDMGYTGVWYVIDVYKMNIYV